MHTSYQAAPTKPEKSTKIDHVRDRTEKKEISNVEKKDRGGDREKQKDRKDN
jgi:hypothetical protein